MIGLAQINALLSSQTIMKTTGDLNSNRNLIKGQIGVLNSEIKMDKSRGLNTKNKEERLLDLENNSDSIMSQISKNTYNLNDKIAKDNEKINEEKLAEEKANEKATETKIVDKAVEAEVAKKVESADFAADGTSVSRYRSAKFVDTVDISMFGRNMAAYASPAAPEISHQQTSFIGEIIDIKA